MICCHNNAGNVYQVTRIYDHLKYIQIILFLGLMLLTSHLQVMIVLTKEIVENFEIVCKRHIFKTLSGIHQNASNNLRNFAVPS